MDNTFPVIVDGGKGTAGDPEWLTSVSPEVLATADATTAPDIPGGYTQGNGWSTAETAGDTGTYDTGVYAAAVPGDWGEVTEAPAAVSVPQATGRDNMLSSVSRQGYTLRGCDWPYNCLSRSV